MKISNQSIETAVTNANKKRIIYQSCQKSPPTEGCSAETENDILYTSVDDKSSCISGLANKFSQSEREEEHPSTHIKS